MVVLKDTVELRGLPVEFAVGATFVEFAEDILPDAIEMPVPGVFKADDGSTRPDLDPV